MHFSHVHMTLYLISWGRIQIKNKFSDQKQVLLFNNTFLKQNIILPSSCRAPSCCTSVFELGVKKPETSFDSAILLVFNCVQLFGVPLDVGLPDLLPIAGDLDFIFDFESGLLPLVGVVFDFGLSLGVYFELAVVLFGILFFWAVPFPGVPSALECVFVLGDVHFGEGLVPIFLLEDVGERILLRGVLLREMDFGLVLLDFFDLVSFRLLSLAMTIRISSTVFPVISLGTSSFPSSAFFRTAHASNLVFLFAFSWVFVFVL